MHPVAAILEVEIAKAGWRVSRKEEPDAWWADGAWVIESGDASAVLTFLVDPQADVHRRKKGASLWAVKASATALTHWQSSADEVSLALGKNWASRIEEFIRSLDRFRTKEPIQTAQTTPGLRPSVSDL